MTTNRVWLYLEELRRSGEVNMYGAVPYLQEEFCMTEKEAKKELLNWMKNYNREDYEDVED